MGIKATINKVYSLPHTFYAVGVIFYVFMFIPSLFIVPRTLVQSLGWEDSLEEEMATDSSIFPWKIPWMEKPGGLQTMMSQELNLT